MALNSCCHSYPKRYVCGCASTNQLPAQKLGIGLMRYSTKVVVEEEKKGRKSRPIKLPIYVLLYCRSYPSSHERVTGGTESQTEAPEASAKISALSLWDLPLLEAQVNVLFSLKKALLLH